MNMFCQHDLPSHLFCFALVNVVSDWRVDDAQNDVGILFLKNSCFYYKPIANLETLCYLKQYIHTIAITIDGWTYGLLMDWYII